MKIFEDILKSSETLFKNDAALDFNYQPKVVPYREKEQRQIAQCIEPMFSQRTGRNIFVFGRPGVGKTVACKKLLEEIEEQTDGVVPLYINCWQANTTHKIMIEMCSILDYKFTQNRKTEELFNVVKQLLNRKCAVFVFDEADKLEDFDFLYLIAEDIFKKSIVMITNKHDYIRELDDRIRSRLAVEPLEFMPYSYEETEGILKFRMEYAFWPNVWSDDAFKFVAKKTYESGDIRKGLHLMMEAANIAESKSSRKILIQHAEEAFSKSTDFFVKKEEELTDDERRILGIVCKNSGSKIGELYKIYSSSGGTLAYKSFQRKIEKLQKNSFITTEKKEGGKGGNTTIVKKNQFKKLTDYD